MELLSPAGNVEKLKYGYIYGADAVYIGLKIFLCVLRQTIFMKMNIKKSAN